MADPTIYVESLVSGTAGSENYLKGLVRFRWGSENGVMSPDEAIAHAIRVIEVANGAKQDELIVKWITQELGASMEEAYGALHALRKMRGVEEGPAPSYDFSTLDDAH